MLLTITGCGGDAGRGAAASACAEPSPSELLDSAVRSYIAGRSPTPLRFLTAVGTDSAMPNAGMLVLQDKGPTYLFPADSTSQAKVRERLNEAAWASLLVTYHGIESTGEDAATVRLGGTWVSGELDGQSAGHEDVGFICREGSWTPIDSLDTADEAEENSGQSA